MTPKEVFDLVQEFGGQVREAWRHTDMPWSTFQGLFARHKRGTFKRVLATGDWHCGHRAGLTPPPWQSTPHEEADQKKRMYADLQVEMWDWFSQLISKIQPIDVLIGNGDLIDGKGDKSGGVEQTTTDLKEQADMAIHIAKFIDARTNVFTRGTPYHVNGKDFTNYEQLVAEAVKGRVGSHEWVDVNGVVFDVKHKIGGSSVPWGRATAIKKERVWNILWNERNYSPKADIMLRSHVHYYDESASRGWRGVVLPSLQGPSTIYGASQCSGVVDTGCVVFDIYDDGTYAHKVYLMDVQSTRPTPIQA